MDKNIDNDTVASFGDEWRRFDQAGLKEEEAKRIFNEYFSIFPWMELPPAAEGFDMGCGSGRWAQFVAPNVSRLHCIDPSLAIDVARRNLAGFENIIFHNRTVGDPGLPEATQDFGYSLGVLHHVPDTLDAIRSCVALLKPGAPLLLYLYYAHDNRPYWFRAIWRATNLARLIISRLPAVLKHAVTDLIAISIYWPLARLSNALERLSINTEALPLSYYRNLSFYTMRTDARDRFGTPLEKRFSRAEIEIMMHQAGLSDIRFSNSPPYWCAVGIRSSHA